jgi:antitoxin MazE
MHVAIRQIGNSLGVVIPKPFLTETGLDLASGVEMTLEGETIVLRKPVQAVRIGWSEAAQRLAQSGVDSLAAGSAGVTAGQGQAVVW